MIDDKEHIRLFRKQLRSRANEIMALAPSSRGLCDLMVSGLRPNFGNIIELGVGTGKITESLLSHGFRQNQLALFEINPDFCATLRNSFPQCHVLCKSAEELHIAPLLSVQAIVSGLPILSFRPKLQQKILHEAFRKMKAGGVFIQYTYGIKPPIARSVCKNLNLAVKSRGYVLDNLPPARVYEVRKAYI